MSKHLHASLVQMMMCACFALPVSAMVQWAWSPRTAHGQRNKAKTHKDLPARAKPYLALVQAAARRHRLPTAFVLAVIEIESHFDPKALSPVGAQGLMQLMPATARSLGVKDSFDAAQNIEGGCAYLAWLKARYAGDINLILAAYNAGVGLVRRRGGIPSKSVRRYVQRGVRAYTKYQRLLAAHQPADARPPFPRVHAAGESTTTAAHTNQGSTQAHARRRWRLLIKRGETP